MHNIQKLFISFTTRIQPPAYKYFSFRSIHNVMLAIHMIQIREKPPLTTSYPSCMFNTSKRAHPFGGEKKTPPNPPHPKTPHSNNFIFHSSIQNVLYINIYIYILDQPPENSFAILILLCVTFCFWVVLKTNDDDMVDR